MKSLLLLSAMLAAPAMAQTASPPASTNTAQPAATAQQAPQPATDAPTTQTPSTATPSTATQPAPTTGSTTGSTSADSTTTSTTSGSGTASTANASDAVANVVSTDWAKYDGNTDGNLSKEEFTKWMTALREQNPAQKAEVKDVNAWTSAAFTQADKDKSGSVSKDELQGFLKG